MKKLIPLLAILLVILLFGFYSCQKQLTSNYQPANVAKIKDWFTASVLNAPGGKNYSGPVATPANTKILWDKAVYYKIKDNEIFEMPIASKTISAIMISPYSKTSAAPKLSPQNFRNNMVEQRLVITQYPTGEKDYAVMNIVADSATRANGYKPEEDHYKKFSKQFSGMVLFRNWQGQFLNGWIYKDGKIAGTMKQKKL